MTAFRSGFVNTRPLHPGGMLSIKPYERQTRDDRRASTATFAHSERFAWRKIDIEPWVLSSIGVERLRPLPRERIREFHRIAEGATAPESLRQKDRSGGMDTLESGRR